MTSDAPDISAAYGAPQALTWNIGTTGIMRSAARMHIASGALTAKACSSVERWLYSTPLGRPVVPEV